MNGASKKCGTQSRIPTFCLLTSNILTLIKKGKGAERIFEKFMAGKLQILN